MTSRLWDWRSDQLSYRGASLNMSLISKGGQAQVYKHPCRRRIEKLPQTSRSRKIVFGKGNPRTTDGLISCHFEIESSPAHTNLQERALPLRGIKRTPEGWFRSFHHPCLGALGVVEDAAGVNSPTGEGQWEIPLQESREIQKTGLPFCFRPPLPSPKYTAMCKHKHTMLVQPTTYCLSAAKLRALPWISGSSLPPAFFPGAKKKELMKNQKKSVSGWSLPENNSK